MARSQDFYGTKRVETQKKHSKNKEYDRKKLIVKTAATIKVYDGYINIKDKFQDINISFLHIYSIFINTNASISLADLYKLATLFKVYFIDGRGYLKGRVLSYEKK